MPRLPVLAGTRVVRALENAGFKVVRIRGSHHVLRHPDGRGTSVPVHGDQDVRVGTLRGILRDCGLTADELLNLLDLRRGRTEWLSQLDLAPGARFMIAS
jgi:predicted RNA binding protein YcfA (HicA-like mRNA interferase family)